MKVTFKAVVAIFFLTLAASGCETKEQFVTKADGIWKMENFYTKTYRDNMVESEVTLTDSLPSLKFEMIGRGVRTDFAGVQDTFLWSLNADDDRITMYYKYDYVDASISDETEDAMTLHWRNEYADGIVMVKTEKRSKIKRVY